MNLTRGFQNLIQKNLTMEDALPTKMPVYVNSFAYLFGVISLSSLVMLIGTGVVMTIFGPEWYHFSSAGRFLNSMHFWSVQLLFGGIIMHLLTKFFMAAWRGGRWLTWVIGVLSFLIAAVAGLTGFLSQTNFDSQWISVQAKDAVNAAGLGQIINTMNTGQILTLHIVVLPLAVCAFVGIHILLIRRDSPVRPISGEKKVKVRK